MAQRSLVLGPRRAVPAARFAFAAALFAVFGCAVEPEPLGPPDPGPVLAGYRFGDEADDRPLALAVTRSGEAVIAGRFDGSLPFLGDRGEGGGLFVGRVAEDGSAQSLSTVRLGRGSIEQLRLALDPLDAPLIGGTALGPALELGGRPIPGEGSILALRLGPDGWTGRRLGGPGDQVAVTLAAAPGGDRLIGGRFGALDLGPPHVPVRADGGEDGFVARLGADLEPKWRTVIAAPGGLATVTALAVEPGGRSLAAVRTTAAAPAAGLAGPGVALVRLSPDGRVEDRFAIEDPTGDLELTSAVADRAATWIVGSFRGRVRAGEVELSAEGVDGLWLQVPPGPIAAGITAGHVGGPGVVRLASVGLDRRGRPWLSGTSERAPPAGLGGAWLARLDEGQRVRPAVFRTEPPQQGFVVAVNGAGWWLLSFRGGGDVGPVQTESAGGLDGLLVRFAP